MNERRLSIGLLVLMMGLAAVALTLLRPGSVQAQPPVPTRLAPLLRVTPTPTSTPLRMAPLAPPRVTATPRPVRATPVTPASPCIHLTTDGVAGASFVGGRIAERCFAFPGSAGAVASIRLTIAGAIPPMELRGPDGSLVATSRSGDILSQPLALDGPYAVMLLGAGMPQPVRVELAVTVEGGTAPAPSSEGTTLCSSALTPGSEETGIVPFPGEDCRYTFQGQRGQSIGVHMESLSPDLAPDLALLDPSGNLLDLGHALSDHTSYASALNMPATGTYTVVAGSRNSSSAGAFKLTLQPVRTIRCGDTLSLFQLNELTWPAGALTCDLRLNLFGSMSLQTLIQTLDGFAMPGWVVLGPTNRVVATDQATTWSADATGWYTLRLRSTGGQSGRLLLEVSPQFSLAVIGPSCGATLTYGESLGTTPVTLSPAGSACLFFFNGAAGDLVWVATTRAGATSHFDPVVELMAPGYRPSDAPEAAAYSGQVPGMAVLRDHPLARSGRYTVRISDYGDNDTGSFYIMVWKR